MIKGLRETLAVSALEGASREDSCAVGYTRIAPELLREFTKSFGEACLLRTSRDVQWSA